VNPPKASLYVWAKIPSDYSSMEYATKLLDEAGVVVIPGVGYGDYGEGYIRLSLSTPDDRLEEGLSRLTDWHASQEVRK
jgi:LL-diaminopimelate aminotransferase